MNFEVKFNPLILTEIEFFSMKLHIFYKNDYTNYSIINIVSNLLLNVFLSIIYN